MNSNLLNSLFQRRSLMAFGVQIVFFGLFFFIDAKQTVATKWQSVVSFGLNPVVILFFGLSPLALWWSYREIMAVVESFWIASMIQGLVLQIVYIICSCLGTKLRPSFGEMVGLALGMITILVTNLLNRRWS